MIKVIDERQKKSTVWFGDLDIGDTFLIDELLFIKCDEVRNIALNLSDNGAYESLAIDAQVIPVDVEIKVIH